MGILDVAVIVTGAAAVVSAIAGCAAAAVAYRVGRAAEAGQHSRWRGEHQYQAYQSLVMACDDHQRAAMEWYGHHDEDGKARYRKTYWAIDRCVRAVALAGPEHVVELAYAVQEAKEAFHQQVFASGHPVGVSSMEYTEALAIFNSVIKRFMSAANSYLSGLVPVVSRRGSAR